MTHVLGGLVRMVRRRGRLPTPADRHGRALPRNRATTRGTCGTPPRAGRLEVGVTAPTATHIFALFSADVRGSWVRSLSAPARVWSRACTTTWWRLPSGATAVAGADLARGLPCSAWAQRVASFSWRWGGSWWDPRLGRRHFRDRPRARGPLPPRRRRARLRREHADVIGLASSIHLRAERARRHVRNRHRRREPAGGRAAAIRVDARLPPRLARLGGRGSRATELAGRVPAGPLTSRSRRPRWGGCPV